MRTLKGFLPAILVLAMLAPPVGGHAGTCYNHEYKLEIQSAFGLPGSAPAFAYDISYCTSSPAKVNLIPAGAVGLRVVFEFIFPAAPTGSLVVTGLGAPGTYPLTFTSVSGSSTACPPAEFCRYQSQIVPIDPLALGSATAWVNRSLTITYQR